MLTLSGITKDYQTGDQTVHALKGVSVCFRKSEFVAILGPSGCGKTTLLNIIGGLDRYTQGDLVIKGRSTREYTDRDWDTYRNHSVGFVFQSYNLIPHQTVLSNVELALTLSGAGPAERRQRAMAALERVGLKDQMSKKPNEMSGGQMQRVAIARALVNDPEILLCDEPTGALDSETSLQIMDILREIASDRLVIMVTHNPDLAKTYATRIIRLLDGAITEDSLPFDGDAEGEVYRAPRHASLGFATAVRLSLNNLMTKKGRTFLVSFAGSIGIIGIALILALSTGVNNYIKSVEEDTLTAYPLTLQKQNMDSTAALASMMAAVRSGDGQPRQEGRVYSSNVMGTYLNRMVSDVTENDLQSFKQYLEQDAEMQSLLNGVRYTYNTMPYIYNENAVGGLMQVHPSTLLDNVTGTGVGSSLTSLAGLSGMTSSSSYSLNAFFELNQVGGSAESGYTLLHGRMPQAWNELLLVVGEKDDISDTVLYTLGLRDMGETQQLFMNLMSGQENTLDTVSYSYEELMNLTFRLVLPGDMYVADAAGIFHPRTAEQTADAAREGQLLRITGIARASGNSLMAQFLAGGIGYLPSLTDYVVEQNSHTAAVEAQNARPDTDIFTGILFAGGVSVEPSMALLEEYLATLPAAQQTMARTMMATMSEEAILKMMRENMAKQSTSATYETNLALLGASTLDTPTQISLYPADFEAKERVVALLEAYNTRMREAGQEGKVIAYTDYVGALMSNVTAIVNTISYVLIAFVSVSLVVSSIMIAIITYISVLERTKEIGILRAMGASKGDVSRVFTAETLLIGLVAGAIGIGFTALMTIPINALIYSLTQVRVAAALPGGAAVVLIVISVVLTVIAGFVPSRMAAHKDPVVALRVE